MNEVKTIHLGRQQYTIAVDAYRELRAYLDAIAQQVGADDGDVLKEVELRMAELLTERGVSQDKVVLSEDITFLKEQLGDPKNFKDEDDPARPHAEPKTSTAERKLYRDPEHGMIAGVATGLATYLNIDVIVVRILFAVSVLASGAGIVAYVLLWILAPEVKTSSDRLKMRGKAVTVDSIKQAVDRADIPGAASRATKSVGPIVERFFMMLVSIFGVIVVGIAAIMLMITAGIAVLTLSHGVMVGQNVIFPINGEHYVLVAAAIMVAIALEALILIGGLAMVRRKSVVKAWEVTALVVIFFIGSSVAGAMAAQVVPEVRQQYKSMHQTTQYELQPFTSATLIGKDLQFSYQQDSSYFIEVRTFADKQQGKDIKKEVVDGRLTVDTSAYNQTRQNCSGLCLFEVNDAEITEVVVHAPAVTSIKVIAGEGENGFMITKPLTSPQFELSTEGEVQIRMNQLTFDKVALDLSNKRTKSIGLTNVSDGENTSNLDVSENTHLHKAQEATITLGNRTCEEAGNAVSLVQVGSIVINGEKLSAADIRAKQTEAPNLYNCLLVD